MGSIDPIFYFKAKGGDKPVELEARRELRKNAVGPAGIPGLARRSLS
jgi:hypothetical protein